MGERKYSLYQFQLIGHESNQIYDHFMLDYTVFLNHSIYSGKINRDISILRLQIPETEIIVPKASVAVDH